MAIDLNGSTGISLDDNEKINIGNDSDLQIYHDGSHSRILDNGTGDLYLQGNNLYLTNTAGNNYFGAISGGAASLYHNNAAKLATTSTGITVTGTVAATAVTGDGSGLTGTGSPSIDDNGNATAMTIDSDENVLIGTTDINPYDNTTGSGIALRSSGAIYNAINNGTSLNLNRMGSDGTIAQFRQGGAAVGNIGSVSGVDLFVAGNRGAGQRYLLDNILPCNSTGNVTNGDIDLGTADYKYRDLFLGGGIYLGGGVAANKLDDYEEGTFTPVVAGGSSAGTASYFTQSGSYTKVGNLVTVWIRLNYTGGNGSGSLQVKGFPFTVVTTNIPTFVVYTVGITAPSTTFPAGFCNLSDGIQLVQNQTGGNAGPTLAYDGSGEIVITGTYPTNA